MVARRHDIPGNFVDEVAMETHAAATATEKRFLWTAPFKCKIVSIAFLGDAAMTGDNTNSTNLNIINGTTTGLGTTELGNKDYVTSTNHVLGTPDNIYAPATPATFDEGTRIILQFEKVGSGLLVPRGTFIVTYYAA